MRRSYCNSMSGAPSDQTPETEVIACPACKHLLRVPLDWLGTQVQCPECKALFRAPVRSADGKLTEPELLSPVAVAPQAARRKPDLMLMLPAFGLLLCGFTGVAVNGVFLWMFLSDPAGGEGWARNQVKELRKFGFGTPGTPEEMAAEDERSTQQLVAFSRWGGPPALVASAVVLAGGLSIVFRWSYRLAQVACVLAAVNVAHFCCVPGAAFGLWGLLMLGSDEGREHFLR